MACRSEAPPSDLVSNGHVSTGVTNDRPIIGVLAQEIPPPLDKLNPGKFKSYIAASYVKFIESSGARVVPIMIGQEKHYYETILMKINGVLFPGGATWFHLPNGYADAGEHILELAQKINDEGHYFPLWGTCLGFELLLYLDLKRIDSRDKCKNFSRSLNLQFVDDFKTSKMFSKAPDDIISILSDKPVTYNYHQFCFTEKTFSENNLSDNWRIMSKNSDLNGLEYVSTVESKKYPFYGVQFHPEKCIFEWQTSKNIPHSEDAIKANVYFADFFIGETRKNDHRFEESSEEAENLIYNYPITYTGKHKTSYEQCYFFE